MDVPATTTAEHRYRRDGFWVVPVERSIPHIRSFRDELLGLGRSGKGARALARGWTVEEMIDHPLRRWCHRLAKQPALLSAVSQLIGPDIYLRNIDVICARPLRLIKTGWHVDSACRSDVIDRVATVWLALTEAHRYNGCLQLIRASHREPVGPALGPGYLLQRLTNIDPALRDYSQLRPGETALSELVPGQFSIHHPRVWHCAGPNLTLHSRIGVVFRFYSAHTTEEAAGAGRGVLVSGSDEGGRFQAVADAPLRCLGVPSGRRPWKALLR